MRNLLLTIAVAPLLLVGCASNDTSAPATGGGVNVKTPHLEKVWLADGFTFAGYDTVYVGETKSTAKFQPDEEKPHETAKRGLQQKIADALKDKKLFANVVTRESDIPAGAKALRLENTIVEYSKGGGAARYFAGLYGAGQPVLKVEGKVTDGAKPVFNYTARRSGVSAGARMAGGVMTDESVQAEDINSMVKDLTDFIERTAKGAPKK